jgi:hypothetical protein
MHAGQGVFICICDGAIRHYFSDYWSSVYGDCHGVRIGGAIVIGS